jgi:hypothetical protein
MNPSIYYLKLLAQSIKRKKPHENRKEITLFFDPSRKTIKIG